MRNVLAKLDHALEIRGTNQTAVSRAAGKPGLIANWRSKDQSPSIVNLGEVASAMQVDPGWLAYAKEPEPVPTPNGFHAIPEILDQPDTLLGVAYSAWKADDGQLEPRFFDALEMIGLADSIYLIGQDGENLRYDHVGPFYVKTLGLDWWKRAPGSLIIEDPDQTFAAWCLNAYQRAMHTGDPARDRCMVVSRYTGQSKGWKYDRLLLPVDGGLVVINEVRS